MLDELFFQFDFAFVEDKRVERTGYSIGHTIGYCSGHVTGSWTGQIIFYYSGQAWVLIGGHKIGVAGGQSG